MIPKVFVTRPIPRAAVELLSRYDVTVHPFDSALKPLELGEACRDAAGMLCVAVRVNEEVLSQTPHLKVVANCGVGYDNIDVEACTRRGIVVTNTPDAVTEATADIAFALLLAVARRVVELDRTVREGRWQRWEFGAFWGSEVNHKTLGIVGFGRIGRALAHRACGFGMRVLYHSRRRVEESVERELSATRVDLKTLLTESDFISLHVPHSAETQHLLGAKEFELMKPSAFLINTSRGKVVDETALVEALHARRIAGAGLDVYEHEPHPHPELPKLDNVVLLPHVGSATAETRLRMARCAAENLVAALEGRRPADPVNPVVLG